MGYVFVCVDIMFIVLQPEIVCGCTMKKSPQIHSHRTFKIIVFKLIVLQFISIAYCFHRYIDVSGERCAWYGYIYCVNHKNYRYTILNFF